MLLLGPMDCIVVKVVVKERTEGAGLEKVLSPPRRDSTPPPRVRLVPVKELAPWLGAVIDRAVSLSVETVPAMLLPPAVGGAKSTEYRPEWPPIEVSPVWCVVNECSLYRCRLP